MCKWKIAVNEYGEQFLGEKHVQKSLCLWDLVMPVLSRSLAPLCRPRPSHHQQFSQAASLWSWKMLCSTGPDQKLASHPLCALQPLPGIAQACQGALRESWHPKCKELQHSLGVDLVLHRTFRPGAQRHSGSVCIFINRPSLDVGYLQALLH